MIYRWYALSFCTILFISFFITGCTQESKVEPTSIKVVYDNEHVLDSDYVNAFRATHPDINLELVSRSDGSITNLISTEKPDVLLLNSGQYERLAAEGKLLALDTLLLQSEYSLDSMHPAVMEVLRSLGNNGLYGLAPTFTSSVLFYNKALFEQFNIDYPTDQMTWEQILELAARFPKQDENGERMYGLTLQPLEETPTDVLSLVNRTEGLNEVDTTGMKLMMDSAHIKGNVEMVIQAFKTGAIQYMDAVGNSTGVYIEDAPFVNGKSAMYYGDMYFFHLLSGAYDNEIKEFDWDIVTEPIDPRNPESSASLALNDIFAITADSSNEQAAWEFIKYVNSDEMARSKSKSSGQLLSRTELMVEKDGRSLEAFYKLTHAVSPTNFELPDIFSKEYGILKAQQFDDVLNDKKSLEEALDIIQKEGQTLLEFSLR